MVQGADSASEETCSVAPAGYAISFDAALVAKPSKEAQAGLARARTLCCEAARPMRMLLRITTAMGWGS